MFVNGIILKTKQFIDTIVDGSSNFTIATGIKNIVEVVAADKHIKLYG